MKKELNIYNIVLFHILIIISSNFLVQYPFTIMNLHTTWGAFTYPLTFITTDLTTRIIGPSKAKTIIFAAMLPGAITSYIVSTLFVNGIYQDLTSLFHLNMVAFRISLACFMAYIIGQLLDILIFQKLRNNKSWWLAPSASSLVGNFIDTVVFFFLAFYGSNIAVLRDHWIETAAIDFCLKYFVTLVCFIPLYRIILNTIIKNYSTDAKMFYK